MNLSGWGDEGRFKDALRVHLTGAASTGAPQGDPALALGGYRAADEVCWLGAIIDDPIYPVVLEKVFAGNGVGTGYIRGDEDGYLYYTGPGDSEGEGCLIGAGETKVLYSNDTDKAVRVYRDGGASLYGTMKLTIIEALNNFLAAGNISTADRAAGVSVYRAAMLYAAGPVAVADVQVYLRELGVERTTGGQRLGAAGTGYISSRAGTFEGWPVRGFAQVRDSSGTLKEVVYYNTRDINRLTIGDANYRGLFGVGPVAGAATDTVHAVPGIRYALEAPGGTGAIQTIVNENTAPGGVSWGYGITAATGSTLSLLQAGNGYGLWVHRIHPPGGVLLDEMKNVFYLNYKGA